MLFNFTPEEAQPAAEAVARYLQRKKMSISVEVAAWDDAPLRTTLVGRQTGLIILVEVQGALNYIGPIKDLASYIAARRHYAELSLAIPSSAVIPEAAMLEEMDRDGVGLFVVDEDGIVRQSRNPKNPALIVTPDPNLRYGRCKHEVTNAVAKFNNIDRKDGLRDLCELVERETAKLAALAARKGLLQRDEAIVVGMDWSNQINILASRDATVLIPSPIFEDKLKDDMHSFRGARNLIDHRVQNKREERERQLQFAERMMQGPRLVAKLVSLQRKIR